MAPFAQAVGLKCGVDIISPTRFGVVVLPRLVWAKPIEVLYTRFVCIFLPTFACLFLLTRRSVSDWP